MDYDFCGYATKNDLRCADGRIIRHNAFKENDGQTVPLVYAHNHSDPKNVIGHALLENRDDGVYAYGYLNDTENGRHAKAMVQHGDVEAMSIYANHLTQYGSDVVHGIIREVSLVLAGANPGAYIENVSFAHADGTFTEVEDEVTIYSPSVFDAVKHDDEEEDDMGDGSVLDELTDEQLDVVNRIIDAAVNDALDDLEDDGSLDDLTEEQLDQIGDIVEDAVNDALEHADDDEYYDDYDEYDDEYDDYDDIEHADDDTIEDVWNTLTDEQKNMVYFLIGNVANGEAKHDDMDGSFDMYHNVFDNSYDDSYDGREVLSHDDFMSIMDDATNAPSLKDVFLAHGVENLEILFPEARNVTPTPDLISRNMDWVEAFWNAVKRTPFARIKSVAANITKDEARAKGYVKGNLKVEEVISLLSRETTPQTIYKKQKLDRDDVVDITGVDVIAFLKQEMRTMLNEEICRAALIGDGRPDPNDPDKIKPDRIRPIYLDDEVYTIHYAVPVDGSDTADDKASKLADAAVRSRKNYQGSGSPWMFATNETISDLILAKDKIGRRLYKDENELKAALRVSRIIEVPVMEGVTRTGKSTVVDPETGQETTVTKTWDLKAIIVNPSDYSIGADKGGAVSLFDDFDIDYNQMKYLIETRCSGALTHPYSAIVLETEVA